MKHYLCVGGLLDGRSFQLADWQTSINASAPLEARASYISDVDPSITELKVVVYERTRIWASQRHFVDVLTPQGSHAEDLLNALIQNYRPVSAQRR